MRREQGAVGLGEGRGWLGSNMRLSLGMGLVGSLAVGSAAEGGGLGAGGVL